MKFTPLAIVGLLAGLGASADDDDDAAPPAQQPVAEWTLWSATRARGENGTACDWSLTIRDEESGRPAERCQFTVEEDKEKGKPCDLAQFANIPCAAESDWVMNGGFSDYQDFMVVVVYNVREEAKAYFGFQSRALDAGEPIPKQIATAFSTKWSHP